MNRCLVWSVLLSLCLGASLPAASAPSATMRLASLEWLPYVGPGLDQEGWSATVVDAAVRQLGYRTTIDYFPWTRAMRLGADDSAYAGYFPAYYTEERARNCHFSAPIGTSTIGLAYLKKTPLHWNALPDLSQMKIGVVAGFSNGPAFDAMVREGKLRVDTSPSDLLNLRKLLAQRVDTVVIDKLVMRYLLLTEPSLAKEAEKLAFHVKPVAELSLHVCFQRTAQGRELHKAFDAALRSLPLNKLEGEYFQRLEQKTGHLAPLPANAGVRP